MLKLNIFQDFLGETSLHGWKFCFDPKTSFRRQAIWKVLCLFATLAFGYYEYELFVEIFVDKPVITELTYLQPGEIEFPDVYFCDRSPEMDEAVDYGSQVADVTPMMLFLGMMAYHEMFVSMKDEIKKDPIYSFQKYFLDETWAELIKTTNESVEVMDSLWIKQTLSGTLFNALNSLERLENDDESVIAYNGDIDNYSTDDMFNQSYLSPERIVVSCLYKNEDCTQDKYWTKLDTKDGICLKFSPPTQDERLVSVTSPAMGLKVVLDFRVDEAIPLLDAGVHLNVHLQDWKKEGLMEPSTSWFTAGPGWTVLAGASSWLYEDKSGKEPCVPEGEKYNFPIFEGFDYSYGLCIQDCKYKSLIVQCECIELVLSNFLTYDSKWMTMKGCSLFQNMFCAPQAINETTCGCPDQCGYKGYNLRISHAKYPNPKLHDKQAMIKKGLNVSAEYMVENYGQVVIFIDDLRIESTTIQLMYNLLNAVGAIGGLFGVFIGASMMTWVELMELVVQLLVLPKPIKVSPSEI